MITVNVMPGDSVEQIPHLETLKNKQSAPGFTVWKKRDSLSLDVHNTWFVNRIN